MIYGYCRISTNKQNIERQVRNILAEYKDAKIIKETFTGARFQGRAEMNKLLKRLKADDTIVFDAVSRMCRNTEEGVALYEELFRMGINLVFLKNHNIDTDIFREAISRQIAKIETGNKIADKFINGMIDIINEYTIDMAKEQVRLAFEQAEMELNNLHQRTKEGIETARRNGKQIGRKKGTKLTTKKSIASKEKIKKYNKTFGGLLTNEETWQLIGISKGTFYKYKKEIEDELLAKLE